MAKQKTVKIDLDIYEYIQEKCIPLEEDINRALRRLLFECTCHDDDPPKPLPAPKPGPSPKPGPQTPISEFWIPILESLNDFGGKATLGRLRKQIYQKMKARLTPTDQTEIPSGRVLRWVKKAGWALQQLKDSGLVVNMSRGVWKITPKGREYLRKERKQNARNGSTRNG